MLLRVKLVAKVFVLSILCFYVVSIRNQDVHSKLLRVTKALLWVKLVAKLLFFNRIMYTDGCFR